MKEGSTTLTPTEFGALVKSLGLEVTEEDLADPSGDRTISFAEFLKVMLLKMSLKNVDKEIVDTFQVFDINGDGFITAEELKTVMNNMGEAVSEKDAVDMIAVADVDGDGRLNVSEYSHKMSEKMSEN